MSKKKVTGNKTINPTKSTIASSNSDNYGMSSGSTSKQNTSDDLLFTKVNYMYILGGILLMAIGFVLMAGGKMPNPETWDDSLIYSTRRTLIAPIFILAGLVVQVVAIFKKS